MMKKLFVIILLIIPSILPAQNTTFKPSKDTLFVVDGVPVDNIKGIRTDSIFSVDVLKQDTLKSVIFGTPSKCVVIVCMLSSAEKIYQKKLSAFSTAYKQYIENNHYKDNNLVYFFKDGTALSGGNKELTKKLFELNAVNIKRVDFSEHQDFSGIKMYTVKITTIN